MLKSFPRVTRLPLAMVIALIFNIVGGGLAHAEIDTTDNVTVEAKPGHPTITVTAPSAIAFGMFLYGDNTMTSSTAGSVKVTGGSSLTLWQGECQGPE